MNVVSPQDAHTVSLTEEAFNAFVKPKDTKAPEIKETQGGGYVQIGPDGKVQPVIGGDGKPVQAYHAPTEEPVLPVEVTNADRTKSVVYMTRSQAIGKNAPRTDPNAKPNDNEKMAAGFATRMVSDGQQIGALEKDPAFRQTLTGTYGAPGGTGTLPYVGNRTLDTTAQQYKQLAENWIRANLRKESGARSAKMKWRAR
jgi:hypothetical protein